MILAALSDYYHRLLSDPNSGISPLGYSLEKISYAIVLNKGGNVVAVDDIRDTSGKKPIPKSLIVPQSEKRTSGIKPNFLWDKTNYVLGVSSDLPNLLRLEELSNKGYLTDEEEKERNKLEKGRSGFENGLNRLSDEHTAFKSYHDEILKDIKDDGVDAFLEFIKMWDPTKFKKFADDMALGEEFLDSNLVFKIDGENCWLHERPAVQALRSGLLNNAEREGKAGICLVTGEESHLARLHPAIKGVNGAQSSGASIVSFNLDSFTSYEKAQGDNAPVSEQAAFAYVTALNHLLRRDNHNRQRLQIGDATVVYWAQACEDKQAEAAEDLFAEFLNPSDEDAQHTGSLRDALEKVKQGIPLNNLASHLKDNAKIFVLGLSPNASRLSIRFFESGSLKMFAERLAMHYEDLSLEPSAWHRPPSIGWLAKVTGPYRKSKDGKRGEYDSDAISPMLAGELARSVLTGSRYPQSLLSNLIMRMRADGEVSDIRVALCKGVLARAARLNENQRNLSNKGELPVSLDTSNTDPGYLLGRLFSVLENIQKSALGKDINATIRDRFYGAASATPASVFPILVRNAQNHLSRLRKDRPGLAINLEKDISDILDLLDTSFPKSMGLEAQGHFTIGYYHQTKARFAEKGAHKLNEDAYSSQGESV